MLVIINLFKVNFRLQILSIGYCTEIMVELGQGDQAN
jgi:hypothetical protein